MSVTENPESIWMPEVDSTFTKTINIDTYLHPISKGDSCLIILNQAITQPLFYQIWDQYKLKVCADGGANQLYDYCGDKRDQYVPHYIIGDLDSLRDDVRDFYQNRGTRVITQHSQYSTDLMKALRLTVVHYNGSIPDDVDEDDGIQDLYNAIAERRPVHILALCAIDGRFDQTIHSITQLYVARNKDPQMELFYLTGTDLIFYVPPGRNYIQYSSGIRPALGNCGMLPMNGEATLSTMGLKWDVHKWSSSLGNGSVSSNNRFVGNTGCIIQSNNGIVMNVEVKYDKL